MSILVVSFGPSLAHNLILQVRNFVRGLQSAHFASSNLRECLIREHKWTSAWEELVKREQAGSPISHFLHNIVYPRHAVSVMRGLISMYHLAIHCGLIEEDMPLREFFEIMRDL